MGWQLRLAADARAGSITLDIYQPIGGGMFFGGVSAQAVRNVLKQSPTSDVNVRIASNGGDVLEGLAIYQDLVDHPGKVVVTIVSIAASMASVIAMAGDEIRIAPGAFVMIHDPLALAVGAFGSDELRDRADLLDKTRDLLAGIYTKRTKAKAADVLGWMAAETWMTPTEAKARGFVDTVLTAKETAAATTGIEPVEQQPQAFAFAALNLGDYQHVPAELAAAIAAASATPIPPPPVADQHPPPGEETPRMAIPKTVLAALGLAETATDAEAEAAAVRLNQGAAVATDLATRVATLEAGTQQSGIEAVIARFSTGPQAKLPPSLHAWARTQTPAQLEAWAASAPPINLTPSPVHGSHGTGITPAARSGVTEGTTAVVTLTAQDLEVCKHLGLDPKLYLAQRTTELERGRLSGQAGG
jgi:ATP-dependent Clp protease protease subunit